MGGLGNQLFQYAAARRLSLFHQSELKLDLSYFDSSQARQYALGPFNIVESFATDEETAKLTGKRLAGVSGLIVRRMQKLKPYYRRRIFAEPHVKPYDPNILRTPKDVYLYGYWQSEKYFVDVDDLIRKDFSFRDPLDCLNKAAADIAMKTDSVSLHVRRGDYVSSSEVGRVFGMCDRDYYRNCVRLLAERVSNPHFFIFSDEPKWVSQNLDLKYPSTIVSHNIRMRDHEDLRLMSLCKHNIVANSTFSWWGAWLNANPNKIVLTPRQWFRDTTLDARDLVPASWTRV